jgi:hypothetical protein
MARAQGIPLADSLGPGREGARQNEHRHRGRLPRAD